MSHEESPQGISRGEIVRVVLTQSRDDDRDAQVNVIHVRAGDPPDYEAAADLAEELWHGQGLSNGSGIRQAMGGGIRLAQITVYDVPENPPSAVLLQREYEGSPWNGSLTTPDLLPPQCSIVASLRTPMAGRSGRGRIYIGGVTTGALEEDGRIGQSTRENLAETVADCCHWSTHGGPEAVRLVVYSPTLGSGRDITSVIVDDAFDVQRSRGQEPTTSTVQPTAVGAS